MWELMGTLEYSQPRFESPFVLKRTSCIFGGKLVNLSVTQSPWIKSGLNIVT